MPLFLLLRRASSRRDQSNVKLQSFFKYVGMGPWGEVKSLGLLIEQSWKLRLADN
jgi:hypothetical protein